MKIIAELTYRTNEKEHAKTYLLGEDNFIYVSKNVKERINPFKCNISRLVFKDLEDIVRIMNGSIAEYDDGSVKVGNNYYKKEDKKELL